MENTNKEGKPTTDEEVIEELKTDRDDSLGYSHEQIDIRPEKPAMKKKKLKPKKRKAKK